MLETILKKKQINHRSIFLHLVSGWGLLEGSNCDTISLLPQNIPDTVLFMPKEETGKGEGKSREEIQRRMKRNNTRKTQLWYRWSCICSAIMMSSPLTLSTYLWICFPVDVDSVTNRQDYVLWGFLLTNNITSDQCFKSASSHLPKQNQLILCQWQRLLCEWLLLIVILFFPLLRSLWSFPLFVPLCRIFTPLWAFSESRHVSAISPAK